MKEHDTEGKEIITGTFGNKTNKISEIRDLLYNTKKRKEKVEEDKKYQDKKLNEGS